MDQAEKIKEKLVLNPALMDRIENILDISSNKNGQFESADMAEWHTRSELNQLGKDVLKEWTEKKEQAHVLEL